jgi:hypothetical protein
MTATGPAGDRAPIRMAMGPEKASPGSKTTAGMSAALTASATSEDIEHRLAPAQPAPLVSDEQQ